MFNIKFPKVRDRISLTSKNIQRELKALEEAKFTGYLLAELPGALVYLFYDSGYPLGGAVEDNRGRRLERFSEAAELVAKEGRIRPVPATAFKVSGELLPHLAGYFASRLVAEDLPGELTNLPEMVEKLKNSSFTGILWGRGSREVVVFFSFGEVLGIFVDGHKAGLGEASVAVKECRVSLYNTERALEVESVIFSREQAARRLAELYRRVYELVRGALGAAEGFELVLRESLIVLSDRMPLLNPFMGFVDVKGPELKLDPAVDPSEIAEGFLRALAQAAKVYLSDEPEVMRAVLNEVKAEAGRMGVRL